MKLLALTLLLAACQQAAPGPVSTRCSGPGGLDEPCEPSCCVGDPLEPGCRCHLTCRAADGGQCFNAAGRERRS